MPTALSPTRTHFIDMLAGLSMVVSDSLTPLDVGGLVGKVSGLVLLEFVDLESCQFHSEGSVKSVCCTLGYSWWISNQAIGRLEMW